MFSFSFCKNINFGKKKKRILYVLQIIQWIPIDKIICNYHNYTIYINTIIYMLHERVNRQKDPEFSYYKILIYKYLFVNISTRPAMTATSNNKIHL